MFKLVLILEILDGFRVSWFWGVKFIYKDSLIELIFLIIFKVCGKIIWVELGFVFKNNLRGFILRIRFIVEINFFIFYVFLLYVL